MLNRRNFCGVVLSLSALSQPRLACAGGIDQVIRTLTGAKETRRATVVLIDQSASVAPDDAALYRAAVSAIIDTVHAGDRIALGTIADRRLSHFTFAFDAAIKSTGNEIIDRPLEKRVRTAARESAGSLLAPGKGAARSFVLDSMYAAAELLAATDFPVKRVVLLSDGLEETPEINFTRQKADAAFAERLLALRKRSGMIPPLNGVEVYLIGAGGRTSDEYGRLRAFWTAYVHGAGGMVKHYGRTAPEFK